MTVAETEKAGLLFKCRHCSTVLQLKDIRFLPFFLAPGDSLGDVKFLNATTKTFYRGGVGVSDGQLASCPVCGVVNLSGFAEGSADSLRAGHAQRKLIIAPD